MRPCRPLQGVRVLGERGTPLEVRQGLIQLALEPVRRGSAIEEVDLSFGPLLPVLPAVLEGCEGLGVAADRLGELAARLQVLGFGEEALNGGHGSDPTIGRLRPEFKG